MIEYNVSDGVCVLRLSAQPLNALTFELLDELSAVDGWFARKRYTCNFANRREIIDTGNRLITHRIGLYYARPADNRRYSDTAFIGMALAGTQGRIICNA